MPGRFEITVAEDKSGVQIKLINQVDGEASASLGEREMLELIKALGAAHAALVEGKPIPPLEGQRISAVFDTRWYVNPELLGEASALSFFHPSYGPIGFLVPMDQVERMVALLTRQIELAKQSRQSLSKN